MLPRKNKDLAAAADEREGGKPRTAIIKGSVQSSLPNVKAKNVQLGGDGGDHEEEDMKAAAAVATTNFTTPPSSATARGSMKSLQGAAVNSVYNHWL